VQVVSFANTPSSGVTTYSTLGLNKYILAQASGSQARQELLTSVEMPTSDEAIVKMLMHVAEKAIELGMALKRGQVVPIPREAHDPPKESYFYCTNPSPLNTRLSQVPDGSPPLVFVYLIHILPNEARMIHDRGWNWFEEQLEMQDPNIWDLSRTSGVHPE
jgi:hypothetical protein